MANYSIKNYLPQNQYIRAVINCGIICSFIGLGLYLGGFFVNPTNVYICLSISITIMLISSFFSKKPKELQKRLDEYEILRQDANQKLDAYRQLHKKAQQGLDEANNLNPPVQRIHHCYENLPAVISPVPPQGSPFSQRI